MGDMVAVGEAERRYKAPAPEEKKKRVTPPMSAGRAPNGPAWSELFMEADAWEAGGTFPGAPWRDPRDQPKPWPTLPPPDGQEAQEQVDWRLTLAGLTVLGLLCVYLAG